MERGKQLKPQNGIRYAKVLVPASSRRETKSGRPKARHACERTPQENVNRSRQARKQHRDRPSRKGLYVRWPRFCSALLLKHFPALMSVSLLLPLSQVGKERRPELQAKESRETGVGGGRSDVHNSHEHAVSPFIASAFCVSASGHPVYQGSIDTPRSVATARGFIRETDITG
ncbi:hypothetical protein ZHAS_00008319 [Anopheles sinensis]|uniref:Uncharacterized protein n=1 Tax=Anopheles sinensis TaxID=74873 RepID=A0A084VRV5_ANOSI|nr:hypothetical protein ZHAS_00008319 [Anopheles sinensis]